MSSRNNDWEEILSRLAKEDNNPQRPRSSDAFPAFLAINIIIAITAVLVMLGNMVVNSAWPSLDAFRPGIGYRDSWFASSIMWTFFLIKTGVVGSIVRAANRDND